MRHSHILDGRRCVLGVDNADLILRIVLGAHHPIDVATVTDAAAHPLVVSS